MLGLDHAEFPLPFRSIGKGDRLFEFAFFGKILRFAQHLLGIAPLVADRSGRLRDA